MRRQEATEDGERERIFPHECFFFWFGLFWETNEGKRMTGRQLEMSCVSLSSPAARLACWHLALLTNSYYCAWMSTMSECVEHSRRGVRANVEQGLGLNPPVVSRGDASSEIISSQASFLPSSYVCASPPFHSSPPLPVASLSAPHAVWWKANQVEKEDPDMEIKCCTSPLIFPLSKPVK